MRNVSGSLSLLVECLNMADAMVIRLLEIDKPGWELVEFQILPASDVASRIAKTQVVLSFELDHALLCPEV